VAAAIPGPADRRVTGPRRMEKKMISRKTLTGVLVPAASVLLALTLAGCASSKQALPQFPKAVEASVTATQSEPDRIEYIDAKSWSVKPGDTVEFSMSGSKDRKAALSLTGLDGDAAGKTQQVDMAAAEPGKYKGSVTVGQNLPPGRYRVEGSLSGGPSGEPVKLVSSRALTVEAPAPPPPPVVDACTEAMRALEQPEIHFAYDKSDLDSTATAYLAQVAQRLTGLGARVGQITVVGHCDERGTVNYNLALGARRATAIKNALLKEPGMAKLNISTLSKGKEEPLVPHATTEEDHARNRRAIFVLECKPAS
jgi:peptidoglycan-associated lipoprotein